MKSIRNALIVFTFLAATFSVADESRVFTDTEGRKITAELKMVGDSGITVQRKDGKIFNIAFDKLSEEDNEYCTDWKQQHADAKQEVADKAAAEKLAVESRAKIVSFCKESMGKQVGNGECWTLADEAFKESGAERPAGQSRVWGRLVDFDKEPLEPGDIVEFKAAKISGYGTTGPNHTVVVVKGGRRGQCTVAEQNTGGVKKVRESSLNLRDLESGEVMVYRPGETEAP